MTQPTFDLTAPAQPKRVTDTSAEAYRELRPKLPAREQAVMKALGIYSAKPCTSYELLETMRHGNPRLDVNSCRPRLTELHARGLVVREPKRRCRITGRLAYTWRVA